MSTKRALGAILAAGAAVVAPLLTAGTAQAATPAPHPAAAPTAVAKPAVEWTTATIQPGNISNWTWNNASNSVAYRAAVSPFGATTTANCQLEVVNQTDVEQPGGEREFHFGIQNIGSIACAGTVELRGLDADHNWTTAGLAPGDSAGYNLAADEGVSYLPGLDPTGATSSTPCKMQISGQHYNLLSDGTRQFHLTVKNVGDITCAAHVRVADLDPNKEPDLGLLTAGSTTTFTWANTNTDLVYVPGIDTEVQLGSDTCKIQIARIWYQQRLKDDGTPSRDLKLQIKNIGTVDCFAGLLLASLDATD
jgi:hypothetical protein